MPTLYIHKVIFAVPITEDNLETMRRFGVATHGDYTPQERIRIMNGTLAYDPADPQARNYTGQFTNVDGGSIPTNIGGSDQLTVDNWGFFQSQLAMMLNNIDDIVYTRIGLNGGDEYKIKESNVPAVDEFFNQVVDEYTILNLMGLYDVVYSPQMPNGGSL